ncbi:hypothetical protein AB0M28_23925 [Streptomyces sp. NPDC051940]|uniref:hypothetical protein n=1 Tax=Streptomyces sp. NPDC051940 TaxID=3155675 RepID=UPI00341AC917
MSNSFGPPPGGDYGPGPGGGFGPPEVPPPGPPGGPPYGPTPPIPPGPPGPSAGGPNNGLIAAISVTISVIITIIVALSLPGGGDDGGDDDSAGGSPSPSSSFDTGSTGATDDSSGSSSGGGSDPGGDVTTPASDPTADAFRAVASGSCLAVWDTGNGGKTEWRWSHDTPPDPVSCRSEDALVQVTGTSGGCSTSDNNGVWTYQSVSTGESVQLCLRRIYHVGGCFLAIQENNRIVDMGPMTAVDCTAKKVPVPYNQVMHITGVYNTSKGTDPSLCRRVQNDQTQYWSWTLDDGETLLCTMVYQG